MRILVLADLHGANRHAPDSGAAAEDTKQKEIPALRGIGGVDVVVSCGDVDDDVIQATVRDHRAAYVLAVKGNHDQPTPFPSPIVDLHGVCIEIKGIRFGGFNGSWQYKSRGHFLYTQEAAAQILTGLPPVDVLVTHNAPRHIHDREDDIHLGFEALNVYLRRCRPRLLLHGHQHRPRTSLIGPTTVICVYGHAIIDLLDSHPAPDTLKRHEA